MNKGPIFIFGAVVAVALGIVALAIAGTGSESAAPVTVEPHDEDGKELFAANCGACHTLAAAGADGVIGPNLDTWLASGGTTTYEGSYGRAIQAVECGYGGGRMPAGILRGENAKEVAAFVGAYAGALSPDEAPLEDTRTAPQEDFDGSCSGGGGGTDADAG